MEMKKGVILLVVTLIFCSFFVSAMNVSQDIYDELAENNNVTVFVSLNADLGTKKINSVKETLGENLTIDYNSGNLISAEINESQLEELKNNSFVSSIIEVPVRKIFLTDSVPLINATSLWTRQINGINLTGYGETVCILDTGVNFSHADLIGKNLTCMLDCISGSCVEDCSIGDWHGHGTHIAGIIGANGVLKGVAPNVNLIGLRVCDSSGNCADDDIIAGMDWCTNNFNTYNISVISLSLGGGQYSSFCDNAAPEALITAAVNRAFLKNISVVVASGNTDSSYPDASLGISSPACVKNSTRVSAINKDETFAYYAFRHENFFDLLFAPGTSIYSTYKNGGYTTMGGTSMSAPHVSGAIAIINQYKKLEQANKLKPDEIVAGINNSGKRKYDSLTGGTFSLLDIYSAVLFLDNSKPEIILNSPANNSVKLFGNVSFNFNVSDLQLRNVSLYIWNSSRDLINQTTLIVNSNKMNFSEIVYLPFGEYSWNVYSEDYRNNSGFYSSNFSFSMDKVYSRLISPINDGYTNSNSITFSCESSTIDTGSLSNVSFYLWNSSSSLMSNLTQNISGILNTTSFNLSNLTDGNYSWACVSYNNFSNFSYGDSNYSFVLDSTSPVISLVSPADLSSYSGAQTIEFQYNPSESNIANCSLILNSEVVSTDFSVLNSATNIFSSSLAVGSYTWKIRCSDKASNLADSEIRSLTISSSSSGGSGGGGGGGGGSAGSSSVSSILNYSASDFEIMSGTTKQFVEGQSIKFFVDKLEHKLVTKSIYSDKVLVNIFSEPIELLIYLNQVQKVDIDNDGYYDLELNYFGASSSKATIYLKVIHEQIIVRHIFNQSDNLKNFTESKNNSVPFTSNFEKPNSFYDKYKYEIFLALWVFWILFLFVLFVKVIKMGIDLYLEKKKANSVNEISSHFKNQLTPHYLNNGVPPNFKRYYPNDYGKNKGL